MADIETKGDDIVHNEGIDGVDHVVSGLSKGQFIHARETALAATRDPWTVLKENVRVLLAIISVQSSALIFGIETVFLNALVGNQAFCKTMGYYIPATDSYFVEAWKISMWAGVYAVSQFVGQLLTASMCDRFGRRYGLYAISLITYVGVTLEVVSPNFKVYTVAKVVMGIATGALTVSVPTYVAEVAPREIRGGALGVFSFNVTLGALVGSLITYAGNQAYPSVTDNRGWKIPLYVGLAAPTISIVGMLLTVTESPYWLTLKGRSDDAIKSIRRLYPRKSDIEVNEEAELLVYTVEMERQQRAANASISIFECFKGINLRRTFIASLPSLTAQLCGNALVQVYSTYFFTLAKIENALAASCVVSALGLVGAIASYFMVENKTIGRFWLLFASVTVITICMLGIGIVNSAYGGVINKQGGFVLVFFVALYNVASSMGAVPGWAYLGESASVQLRAKTSALASSTNAIIGGFWNIVLPYELAAIGPTTGYMFAGFGVLTTLAVWFLIPELSGRTYAEMDELFEKKVPARKFKSTICTGDYGNHQEGGH
ncbi:hypothetical protein EHS25_001332 [Saitozyma podzolica]|uniref:Major facilitator superfamily (MFS) profile domain-containing protein n=1 Tax=Saitozyma podzolica TaxID=1890683 RepID=A0A427YFP5_9TREE|nr:hypothetical protein EHS25_001332 [Saitozyma podzolica]